MTAPRIRVASVLSSIAATTIIAASVHTASARTAPRDASSTAPGTLTPVPAPLGRDGKPAAPPARPAIPQGLGVNIHFTDPAAGEMEMLAAAGFRTVRMDFVWSATEKEKGGYDFSAYDRLVAALEKHGIQPLLILDYSNRHYDDNLSPKSDEGRKAFARWAAAAAKHFRGRHILWEMYNEPNIGFWKPAPNTQDYIALALETGEAIRAAAPGEQYIGPAACTIALPFLEDCFKAGLLDQWHAVTVHPYRGDGPETVAPEYDALRRLIAKYAPSGRPVQILSGEWGYTAASMTPDEQGKRLARMYLTNLACGVPLTIWYDWRDDGTNPKEVEHNFGTVRTAHNPAESPVLEPKPAYLAARAVSQALADFRVEGRMHVGDDADWVLLLGKGGETRYAAWTTAGTAHRITIPEACPGRYAVTSFNGFAMPEATADKGGLVLTVSTGPQYLAPVRGK
jgi:polysaccharide biosynthesis protein PslG